MTSISIGPFALMTSTALVLVSIFLLWIFVSILTKSTVHKKLATDTLFWGMVIGFLASRITFVIALWDVYQNDWFAILDIRDGGFNQAAGWFAGIIFVMIRARGNRKLMSAYLKSALFTGVIIFPLFLFNTLISSQNAVTSVDVVTAQGRPHVVNTQTGKPLIVNFWASWCPPCRRELPILQDAQQKHDAVQFVFINQKESPEKARQFLESQQITIKNSYFDFSGKSSAQLGAYGLPTTLFFNADGELVDSHMGELSQATLQHYLATLLNDLNK
ncbi:TlpA disulfide reductase family protein [Salinimonas profundi]|uniref:TlpA disulfide reductase family protein n=1 Tax=Salinimonas profundi TaxID=2729140 RepID=UPI00295E8D8E|nr:TlpA disulfide reductase family protein [Salinimonas profundi]